jgi:hypothetical protein
VIISGKARDERATRMCARHANRAHHRFGAGTHEAHALHRRQMFGDPLCQPNFILCRRAEDRPAGRKRIETAHECRMRVPEQ